MKKKKKKPIRNKKEDTELLLANTLILKARLMVLDLEIELIGLRMRRELLELEISQF